MVTTIGGNLTKVHSSLDGKYILEDGSWFEIDYGVAGGVMRDIYDNYKKYLEKSRKHRKYTKDRFSFDHMRDLLSEQLKDGITQKPHHNKLV